MILAGDAGATKTLLEVGSLRNGRWQPAFGRRYAAADHPTFDSVLRAFLREWEAHAGAGDQLAQACFGVAGPAFDNRVQMTNVGWLVDGAAIAAELSIPRVRVVNDFAAAAGGIAPKILPRRLAGGFLAAFNAKGAHADEVRKIPLSVVTNERLALLGCALLAQR